MNYLDILKRVDETKIPSWKGSYDKWHALFVQCGEEDKVKERLLYRFNANSPRLVVPKRKLSERKEGRWHIKIRTLFPGYILFNGHLGSEEYYKMKGVPGLINILRDKSGPLVIQEEEIKFISGLIGGGEVIGTSKVYIVGGKIVVIEGPLLGMEGLIEAIDKRKGRAKVRLNFAGEPRTVELSVAMVQAV